MGDFDKLRSILAEDDWSKLNDHDISINDKCEYFTSQIKAAASMSIPNTTAWIRPLTIRG